MLDTGVFKDDRYFDVYVEYAKGTPEEILIRISVSNRGPEPATLHLLPTLWFRNTWTWWPDSLKPVLRQVSGPAGMRIIAASHATWPNAVGRPRVFASNTNAPSVPVPSGSSTRQKSTPTW